MSPEPIDEAGEKAVGADLLVAALETVAQPVWIVDSDGLIRFANRAAVAALGYALADELIGRDSHQTIHHHHPDGRPFPASECPMLLPRKTGQTVTSDLDRFFRADGSMFPVSYASAPLDLPGGRGAVVAFTDIEARLRTEQKLHQREERLTEQDGALRRVATLVMRQASETELFSAIAEEIGELLGAEEIRVFRFENDRNAVVVGCSGTPAAFSVGSRFPTAEDTVASRVLLTGRTARFDDYSEASGPVAETTRSIGVRAAVGAPIMVDGSLWGAVAMGTTRDAPLPPDSESRLVEFTELIATTIANAEARAEIERLADEQAALRRVATMVADQAAPDLIFATVAKEVARIVQGDRCAIGRFEPEEAMTVVAYWSDEDVQIPAGTRIDLRGDDVTAAVRRCGRPVRIDDHESIGGPLIDYARRLGSLPNSTIATPVFVEGRMWGAIFTSTMTLERFPEDSESRMLRFAGLVATAVANAESHEALARLIDEQAALRRVATLVARGVPPAEIFSAVSREVERLFTMDETADLATVVRFDPGPEFVLVGAAKSFAGLPIGSRWGTQELYVSTRVFRTGRSARVEESDLTAIGGREAATLRQQGLISQVGSPITVEGHLWGAITMNANQTLPSDTEKRLENFTELLGTAIANAEGKSELAASRRRIVAASDEARRRIERDLHDGTQQRLVSLGLALRAAEASVPSDRADLQTELSEIATGLASAVEDLQELSRGIHPSVLTGGGLGPALRSLAGRSAIPVELEVATDVDRLPEQVEVTAYFVASEALANATKHARATRLSVSLATRKSDVVLKIRDDGVGGAEPAHGSGLVGLTDRVEAIGGAVDIRSPVGDGTQITVQLPLDLQ
jgi:PAS domain S-box-containing protein